MITLSDQLFASLSLPLDARHTNLVLDGANVTIETEAEYLSRVDLNSRYLGMEVEFCAPAGTHNINDFITEVNSGNITVVKYGFKDGLEDSDFLPVSTGGGGNFDPTADINFSGTNTHLGSETFRVIKINSATDATV
jgi:hypothetical protein